ncbi:MAG: hypothetical protein JXX29_09960 [Deltaproteobacteria bacterium]|nr:hypothetical protein [Deltaproteobacteria bacterium]MBN2671990.1 hypothetical protein [Deltaproteobacteria bacterium]
MMKKNILFPVMCLLIIFGCLTMWGCWEQTEHEYDSNDLLDSSSGTAENDSETGIDNHSTDSGAARDSDSTVEKQNSILSDEWAGFGSACEEESECSGYPSENKRCLFNVMGLVDSPGGYCTACCDTPGENECGPNVDCVGANNSFLICLERCATDADCRTEDNYECHAGLYYMDTIFPGKYCLPSPEYSVVPEGEAPQNTTCPWPW